MGRGRNLLRCGLKFLHVAILWYDVKVMNRPFTICLALLLLLCGCRNEQTAQQPPASAPVEPQVSAAPAVIGCTGCHADILLDAAHQLACTSCHRGVDQEGDKERAHAGLIARPSHPEQMASACGGCHPQQVEAAAASLHFTLANKVNTIRRHFGAEKQLAAPTDIPAGETLATPLDLADDMLRRRCLRCHVYSQGDGYTGVRHATGCGACHLAFKDGRMQNHAFIRPTDRQCLSCHYGNYTGSDYHGRSEHDYHWEYRTPYTSTTPQNTLPRAYGVEWHDLAPDLHQQRGLVCVDCHRDSGHDRGVAITCRTCHGWRPGQPAPALSNLRVDQQRLLLASRTNGAQHVVPSLRHPAHERYGSKVACQVCHGQWSFNDAPTHLLLMKNPVDDAWDRLIVQGSSEVETLLAHNLYYSDELPMRMADGLTGEPRPGVWFQGFGLRRWEQMIVGLDSDGVIKVFRPILDLRLSMTEEDGRALFDNITGRDGGLLPYTPHTTGPAGLFYLDRFRHLLPEDER